MRKYLLSLCFIFIILIGFTTEASAAPTISRLAGGDRYTTAIEISRAGWFSSENVVLATGENFPDALCAAPLAKLLNAPILLTEKSSLNSHLTKELIRLRTKKAFLIGGPGVISENVEISLKSMGIECKRLYGSDRYQTSLAVANYIAASHGNIREMAVATGEDFPDALSISPIAASLGMPMILVPKDTVPDGLENFIRKYNISITHVVGGSNIISDAVANRLPLPERIYGTDKYERNINILNKFADKINFFTIYVATGENYPDALAGSALAALTSGPVVLTGQYPSAASQNFIGSRIVDINSVKALGGEGILPQWTLQDLLYGGNNNLKVHFLNVGRAESILIQTPGGKNMLIDGGNNGDGNAIVSYLRARGIKTLDAVVGTWPGEEHIGGLDTVISSLNVNKVYLTRVSTSTQSYRDLIFAINQKRLSYITPSPGDTIDIDPVVRIEVLSPKEDYSENKDINPWAVEGHYEKQSDYSLVLKLSYGATSFLLTGDAGIVPEKEMINYDYNLSSTVLKVGNHGTSSSTSSSFLDRVKPKYAVISTGRGTDITPPDSSILYNLDRLGAKVYRTDESGTIICTTDGMDAYFETVPGLVSGNGESSSEIHASVYKSGEVKYPTIRLVVTGPAGGEITAVFHYRNKDLIHKGFINDSNEGLVPISISEELNYPVNIDVTVTINGKSYTTKTQFIP